MGKSDKSDKSDRPAKKEQPLVIGHPYLASGASVRIGSKLYISILEAIYRQSRGEYVEIHLHPTEEDNADLAEMRARTRTRWERDSLPDGWTRPVPANKEQKRKQKSQRKAVSNHVELPG